MRFHMSSKGDMIFDDREVYVVRWAWTSLMRYGRATSHLSLLLAKRFMVALKYAPMPPINHSPCGPGAAKSCILHKDTLAVPFAYLLHTLSYLPLFETQTSRAKEDCSALISR